MPEAACTQGAYMARDWAEESRHVGLSDARMRVVASREAVHSALSNTIPCSGDGDDEVIELLGTEAEFPLDPWFAYRLPHFQFHFYEHMERP